MKLILTNWNLQDNIRCFVVAHSSQLVFIWKSAEVYHLTLTLGYFAVFFSVTSIIIEEEITVKDSEHGKSIKHICHIFAAVAQRPVKISYRNCSLQFGEASRNIKQEDKVGITDCVSLTPAWRWAEPLSLTSGALRPLSQQHLISPLNLRLTRSFGSKGLPLCLQPSSTNGAWRGIEERWRVVVRRKNQPRGVGVGSVRLPEACGPSRVW